MSGEILSRAAEAIREEWEDRGDAGTSWHRVVQYHLAVADWLDAVRDRHPHYTDPDGWALCGRCVHLGSAETIWPCAEVTPALAVARAYLGEARS